MKPGTNGKQTNWGLAGHQLAFGHHSECLGGTWKGMRHGDLTDCNTATVGGSWGPQMTTL